MQSNIYWLYPLIIFIMMSVLFLLAQKKKDNSIVDIFWGIGFCLLAFNSFLWNEDYDMRKTITLILVFIWGIRLSVHIYNRNKNLPEDFRYQEWRKKWGKQQAINAYFRVFLLQGFFMFIIALPILHISNFSQSPINLIDVVGIIVWLIGFCFEAIADHQKKQFKSNPENKEKIMQSGLWSISRHPNYFGEILIWWGLWLISLSCARWYFSILSPLVITWLIIYVSGIPLLEAKYKNNKAFEEYKKIVPKIIPKIF